MEYKNRFKKINSGGLLQVISELMELKNLFRQGWLKSGISKDKCESVADHSFGTAITAVIIASEIFKELDLGKVALLAIFHEAGEVFAGDITPHDNISARQKFSMEKEAVERIFGKLENGDFYKKLWLEFEAASSPEAKFVKQIDKLEMAITAAGYQTKNLDLSGFFKSADSAVTNPHLKDILYFIAQNSGK